MTKYLLTFTVFFLWLVSIQAQVNADNFYDPAIRDIRLEFKQDNWDEILQRLKKHGDRRMTAKIVVEGQPYDTVQVRYKGNSSYNKVLKTDRNKLPFNIKFKDDDELYGRYERLKLANIFMDPSFIREVLAYEIIGNYMPSPRANFTELYANNKSLGLFTNVESIDKNFLKNHFDEKKGAFFKCDPEWGQKAPEGCPAQKTANLRYIGKNESCYAPFYERKSDDGLEALISLMKTLDEHPEDMEQYLDVDQTLWMHALNNVLVNLDSYSGFLCHNYYLYQNKSGVFQPLIWDTNLAFGGFAIDGQKKGALTITEMKEMSPMLHYKNEDRPLISKLLAQKLFRLQYVAHCRTLLEDYFKNEKYKKIAQKWHDVVAPRVSSDANKLYDYEDFRQNIKYTVNVENRDIPGIYDLMDARTDYLLNHPLFQQTPPTINDVEHAVHLDSAIVQVQCRVENATGVYIYVKDKRKKSSFKRYSMTANATTFLLRLPVEEGTDYVAYYVCAVNDKAASFWPRESSGKPVIWEKVASKENNSTD